MNPPARIVENAHVTLHFRLAFAGPDGMVDIVNTFTQQPATLQLGTGQLTPGLEARLIGLAEGDHQVIETAEGEAFGPRSDELVQRLSRSVYDFEIDPKGQCRPGDYVQIPGPNGGTFQGLLNDLTPEYALLDFNHPLAGRAVTFEVKIIGVL
ncbi:MAG TPA: peptidylprolyl isomerase [Burkholderiaceae bacterium]|nr:peptidylprolyl isomerase [Burkholderiaceae bacterium]